jgi:hypothetical protein
MKTIIKISIILFIGYFLWSKYAVNKVSNSYEKSKTDKNENLTIVLSGKVSGSFTLFNNQTILTIKEAETEKPYHVLSFNKLSPHIDSLVTYTVRKYDIIKINDKSISLYKEIK